jgi:hypothetical protein
MRPAAIIAALIAGLADSANPIVHTSGSSVVGTRPWASHRSEKAWRAHMQGRAIKRFQASRANSLIQDFALHRMALAADGPQA